MSTTKKAPSKEAKAHAKTTNAHVVPANESAPRAFEPDTRVSQSAIAETAITDLAALDEKLVLDHRGR